MNPIEGTINIDVYQASSQRPQIKVTSSRPLHASKILIGKTPEQALNIIPMLFNICGIAQSRAALLALEQITEIHHNSEKESARNILVLAENAKEYLLRIFLDWPTLFEKKPDHQDLPFLSQFIQDFKLTLFKKGNAFSLDSELNPKNKMAEQQIKRLEQYISDHVFTMPISQWQSIKTISELHHWAKQEKGIAAQSIDHIFNQNWASQGIASVSPLPMLAKKSLNRRFLSDDAEHFIAAPMWNKQCHETTSLTRQSHHPLIKALKNEFNSGLMTRWVARLCELASIPQQMRKHLEQPHSVEDAENTDHHSYGIAKVEAARGQLIHRVEMNHQHIMNHQILAPTEWNFHPSGLVKESLSHIKCKNFNEWQQLARLIINTIDPCVGYQLRMH